MLTHTPRRARFCDHFHRAGDLGRNRQHAHMSASGLPQAVEDRDGGLDQILRGMDSAPLVTEKGAFEMNSQWPRLRGIAVGLGCSFDRIR